MLKAEEPTGTYSSTAEEDEDEEITNGWYIISA
jgi:hypothetical protein